MSASVFAVNIRKKTALSSITAAERKRLISVKISAIISPDRMEYYFCSERKDSFIRFMKGDLAQQGKTDAQF